MDKSNDPAGFRYPPTPHERRHGPAGYSSYASYRPWLRDEFSYRCVYCLIREQWGRVSGEFDLDHFLPQAVNQTVTSEYENLVYSCHSCNLRKANEAIPDPTKSLTSKTVEVHFDGILVGRTPEAERIIRTLFLNSPAMVRWRRIWIRICDLADNRDPDLFRQLFAYPDDIPYLHACRPELKKCRSGFSIQLGWRARFIHCSEKRKQSSALRSPHPPSIEKFCISSSILLHVCVCVLKSTPHGGKYVRLRSFAIVIVSTAVPASALRGSGDDKAFRYHFVLQIPYVSS